MTTDTELTGRFDMLIISPWRPRLKQIRLEDIGERVNDDRL